MRWINQKLDEVFGARLKVPCIYLRLWEAGPVPLLRNKHYDTNLKKAVLGFVFG
jgi:hypothetical protein